MTWLMLILILISLTLVAWFLQNCLHEASHLLIIKLYGGSPTGFYPYPHITNGRFYFARCTFEISPKLDYAISQPKHPVWIAPFWAGLLLAIVSAAATIFVTPFASQFLVCSIIDMLWFWRGYFWGTPECDGKRWRYGTKTT